MFLRVVLVLTLSIIGSGALAAGLSSREWQLDQAILVDDVLEVLTERFSQGEESGASSADYGIAVLARLKEVRDKIHDDSYHIMRNTVLTMSEDFAKLTEDASDDSSHYIHRWQAAEGYIRTKINYVGDLLTITGR